MVSENKHSVRNNIVALFHEHKISGPYFEISYLLFYWILVSILNTNGLDEEAEEVCVLLDGFRCGFSCPVSSVSVHPDQEWSSLKQLG